MSSTLRRASQTRSSPALAATFVARMLAPAAIGIDRSDVDADVNEADEATSTQKGIKAEWHAFLRLPPG